jgi:VWFA-related protein
MSRSLGAYGWLALAFLSVLRLGPSSSFTYSVKQASPQPGTEEALLTFVAVNEKQEPVLDLRLEDLKLFVEGREHPIVGLSKAAELPLTLGLLIDHSGSRRDQLYGAEGEPAIKFLRRVLRPGESGYVGGYSEDISFSTRLTSDVADLAEGILQIVKKAPWGPSAPWASLRYAAERMQKFGGRKVIVIVTDGDDNASPFRVGGAIESAQRSGTTVYAISPPPHPSRSLRTGGRARRELEDLATETGGRAFFAQKPEDFGLAFEQISREILGCYAIRFSPGQSRKKSIKIEVRSARPSVRIHARKRHYFPPK